MATAAIGIIGAMYASRQQKKAASADAAGQSKITKLNMEAAEEDAKFTKLQARQEFKITRRKRGQLHGQAVASAAKSGVDIASGSVRASLIANAREGAYEENIIRLETEHKLRQIKKRAKVTSAAGQAYQSAAAAKSKAATMTAWGQVASQTAGGLSRGLGEGSWY